MVFTIPLVKPFFGSEEIHEIQKVLDSGWVAGQGPESAAFERAFAEKFRFHNAVAVNNCTAALHLAMLCLGIDENSEVLVSDYTFPATGHAVKYCGAKPVFVDVREDTYNFDVKDAENKLTDATKAIVCVHTFGQSADMDAVLAFAKKNGLAVVEDAACAVGAKYKKQFVGEIGDVGCFSFHARKGITTGEGGMVVSKDKKIADHARMLSCFGMRSAFERQQTAGFEVPTFTELGFNYKLSDVLAAIGLAQLAKLDWIIARKRELVSVYRRELEGIEEITPPFEDARCFHVYQSFVCLADEKTDRNKLIAELRKQGVGAQIGTYSSSAQPVYGAPETACPVSQKIFERSLALPLYASMKEEEVKQVVETLKKCLKECVKNA